MQSASTFGAGGRRLPRFIGRLAAVWVVMMAGIVLGPASTPRPSWASAPLASLAPVWDPAPVVMVVFDEFPVASLLDQHGRIDKEDFPNFSRLAEDGTWFRNAVGNHQFTEKALPTILSGVVAPNEGKAPRAADFPRNLFTLLGDRYRVQAVEPLTELCPDFVCTADPQVVERPHWSSLAPHLAVVTHRPFLTDDAPQSTNEQNPEFFDIDEASAPPEWDNKSRFHAAVADDRRGDIARFLDGLNHPLGRDEFHFGHLLIPHRPWDYLPDGREYLAGYLTGMGPDRWDEDEWLVAQDYQKLQIQVQYTDRLIGEMINRLEAHGSYDDTLIIVVADHGVSVRPEQHPRRITPETVGDIASVPLFVKRPRQTDGGIDDYRAETVDVVPTIADVLGIDVLWTTDGTSLIAAHRPRRNQSTMSSASPLTFSAGFGEALSIARYHLRLFGDRGPFGLAPSGYSDLLGRRVDSLAVADDPREKLVLDNPEWYGDMDPAADPLPAELSGRVIGGDGKLTLAVVLNGRIVAVTRSGSFGDDERFVAMIQPALFLDHNELGVLVVRDTGRAHTLTRPSGS